MNRHSPTPVPPRTDMMRGGPFKLPSADPTADADARAKREAIARVKSWVEDRLPRAHLRARDCVVDVSEAACGDPQCAPIDTIIRIIYRGGCGTVFGIPCEADEVEEEEVSRLMPTRAVVDDWAEFQAPGKIAVLIRELQAEVDRVLEAKVGDPGLEVQRSPVVEALLAILGSDGF